MPRAQPARARSPMPAPARRTSIRRPGGRVMRSFYRSFRALVMIDPPVGLDEPRNARGVELVERVDARPCSERDAGLHARVRSEDDVLGILPDDGRELLDDVGTTGWALVLYHHAAVLEIVHLQLLDDGDVVNAPGREIRQMRTRCRRLGVVWHVRLFGRLDVPIALIG